MPQESPSISATVVDAEAIVTTDATAEGDDQADQLGHLGDDRAPARIDAAVVRDLHAVGLHWPHGGPDGVEAGVLHGGCLCRPLHLTQRDLAARRHQAALEGSRDRGDLRNRLELGHGRLDGRFGGRIGDLGGAVGGEDNRALAAAERRQLGLQDGRGILRLSTRDGEGVVGLSPAGLGKGNGRDGGN
jgi:hypothetical protein